MTAFRRAQTQNFHYFDTHAFDELLIVRAMVDKQIAEQKAVQTSFYAPQIYQFQTIGVFGTMFGTQRGKYATLLFRPKSPEEIRLAEWREAFWPTTKLGRTAMEIETKRLKAREDLEKTTRWRMKTWPKRIGRRMGRHIQHLLEHRSFAEKVVIPHYSPFWELKDRPDPWETRVPEVTQVLEQQAAKGSALARKTLVRRHPQSKITKNLSAETTPKEKSVATDAEQAISEEQPSEQNALISKPVGKRFRVRWARKTG